MRRDPLQRRLHAVSRIALYGSLALTLVLAVFFLHLVGAPLTRAVEVTWGGLDYESLEEVRLLQAYVRVDTSEATGNTLDGALFLARELEARGIPAHVERIGEDDANLWAVLEGKDPGAVVLHHHIDVNDAPAPETWLYPPFEGRIDLPWMHGRGTFDMKSVAVAQLLAMAALAEDGAALERSVIFLATAGEESGSELGTRWILRRHPELVRRFEVVLTEGGVVEGRSREDIKYWGTEFAQKRVWTLVACDPSRERLERLREDLTVWGAQETELRLVDEVRRFLPIYARTRDRGDFRDALLDPERIVRDRAVFEELPTYVQAMFRDELHPFAVEAVEGGGFELPVKIHLLPGVELAEVRAELIPQWLFHGVETRIFPEPSADHGSPIGHPVLDAVEETVHESYPRAPAGPMLLPWTATDARFFRARGIPAYGFSPFMVFVTDALRTGQAGERIALPDFVEGVKLYERLLRRLAT